MGSRGLAAAVLVLGVAAVPGDRAGPVDTGNGVAIGQLLAGVRELNEAVLTQKDNLATAFGVLGTIADRREPVAAVLDDVNELTAAVVGLLSEHGPRFGTLLDQLHTITGQLGTSEQDLAAGA